MARGRPPKLSVVTSKHLTKEEKAHREEVEKKLKTKCDLKPPAWLDKDAKKEFKRVVKELQDTELNLLDNLDLSVLAIYTQAYSQYVEITKELREMDLELKPKYYRLQKMQTETIMQCSGKLGLAISDRLRLVVPKQEEKKDVNPFLKYI